MLNSLVGGVAPIKPIESIDPLTQIKAQVAQGFTAREGTSPITPPQPVNLNPLGLGLGSAPQLYNPNTLSAQIGQRSSYQAPGAVGNLTKQGFADQLLHSLGIKPNAENQRALLAWINAEGGNWNNSRRYNPLNTTQKMAGASYGGAQGNIASYNSWQQGLDATLRTITNGRYGAIINALRNGSAMDVANAIAASKWGTGALVKKILGG